MKVLLTGAFDYSNEQLDKIKTLGFDILYADDERTPLQVDVKEVEAVVCNSLFLYNDINNFKNLKFIQLISAGLDRVPLNHINERGIQLYNAGDVYSIPMAEWAILKILETYKNSKHFYQAQAEHRWDKKRDLIELAGKKAAIIGFGNAGKAIAKRLVAFGVKVSGVDIREVESEFIERQYMVEELDEVLKASDMIILTLPLNDETYHIINAERLKLIPDHSILVNLSRGGLIDEAALIESLEKGKFSGVALDVFEEEPLPESSPLWDFEQVIITPHNSYISDRVHKRLSELIYRNLMQFIKQKSEGHLFNE